MKKIFALVFLMVLSFSSYAQPWSRGGVTGSGIPGAHLGQMIVRTMDYEVICNVSTLKTHMRKFTMEGSPQTLIDREPIYTKAIPDGVTFKKMVTEITEHETLVTDGPRAHLSIVIKATDENWREVELSNISPGRVESNLHPNAKVLKKFIELNCSL